MSKKNRKWLVFTIMCLAYMPGSCPQNPNMPIKIPSFSCSNQLAVILDALILTNILEKPVNAMQRKNGIQLFAKTLPIIQIPAITNEILMTFFEPTLSEIIPPTKLKKIATIIGAVNKDENFDVVSPKDCISSEAYLDFADNFREPLRQQRRQFCLIAGHLLLLYQQYSVLVYLFYGCFL